MKLTRAFRACARRLLACSLVNPEGTPDSFGVIELGLTNAVAKVLKLSQAALTPAQIRDELARTGFDIKRYSSIIPSISKVLERLHKKGQVDIGEPIGGGRKVYIWRPIQPKRLPMGKGLSALFTYQDPPYLDTPNKADIDPFAGHGSVPMANPPYAAAKKKGKK